MKKYSYTNKEEQDVPKLNKTITITSDSATEAAGRNGFSLQEMLFDQAGVDPSIYDKIEIETNDFEIPKELLSLLSNLSENLEEQEDHSLANFSNFLLRKFSSAEKIDYVKKFNELVLTIQSIGLENSNQILKNLAKKFSKTILFEINEGQDREDAERIAYNRIVLKIKKIISEI